MIAIYFIKIKFSSNSDTSSHKANGDSLSDKNLAMEVT